MKYQFSFLGGSKTIAMGEGGANSICKFHLYICDPVNQEEHHLYQAVKNGIAKVRGKQNASDAYGYAKYECIHPVVKVFTSTRGFGIPQEYFSYFFLLSSDTDKSIRIKPLGFDRFAQLNHFGFLASGRFLKDQEVARLYGKNSKTYTFFKRQSYISARRIRQMVEVVEMEEKVVKREEVRMLRI